MAPTIARWCYQRRWITIIAWIFLLVGVSVVGNAIKDDYRADYSAPGSDSKRALDVLTQKLPKNAGDSVDLVYYSAYGLKDPAFISRLNSLRTQIRKVSRVEDIVEQPRGSDGKTGIDKIQTSYQVYKTPKALAESIIPMLKKASTSNISFELSGVAAGMAEQPNFSSEGIGLFAALLILLFAFGTALAAGIPIGISVIGIGVTFGIIGMLTNVVDVPDWAEKSVAPMIGIGVGIDYALFILTRYRSALARGKSFSDSANEAMNTAGRAVLFAGCTVVISLLGLSVMHVSYLYGVALAASTSVLVIMVASITLLPAILAIAGDKINKFRVPFAAKEQTSNEGSFWFRWSRSIQHRPWIAVVAGSTILLLLSLPLLGLRLGFPDDGNSPKSYTTRRAYDLKAAGYGKGFNGPIVAVVEFGSERDMATLSKSLVPAISGTKGVAVVVEPKFDKAVGAKTNSAGQSAGKSPTGFPPVSLLTIIPETSPQDKKTEKLIKDLRSEVIPKAVAGSGLRVSLGGPTASYVDSSRYIADRLISFILAVVLLSFLLLMVVFRSIWVPVKAAIMNLLSIGAAYGVMAYAVSGSWLGRVVGIPNETPIPAFVPMMMFAILFGLSMDYEVFLLSRIREEYARTKDNATAVADGLASTARVITAAAAIMVSVFAAFILIPQVFIKAIGLGMATAIFVDATIVRLLLVPATMELLGDRNWWYPKWLDRITPHINIEGSTDTSSAQEAVPVQ